MKKLLVTLVVLVVSGITHANLIQNGSYESGADYWYTGGGTIVDTDAVDGIYCAQLYAEDTGDNLDWRSAGVSVLPGEELTLIFSYKTTDVLYDNSTQVRFRFFSDSGWIGEAQSDLAVTNGQWQEASLTYTSPDEVSYFDVWFTLNTFGDRSTGAVLFDSVVVTPEPATMISLALGGLGVLVRRK